MLLSPSDRAKFIILYRECNNKDIATIFNTNVDNVIKTAKALGIYESKRCRSEFWDRTSAEKNQ